MTSPKIEALTKERGSVYGPPLRNHSRTARLWEADMANRQDSWSALTCVDVCFLNILQKIARAQEGHPHRDHCEDIMGYAQNILEIWGHDRPPRD